MRSPLKTAEAWNRRLHYYAGLLLLPFLALFAFTGLILNHPKWTFAEFWPTRHEVAFERPVAKPAGATDLEKARDLMRQLGVSGEIDWTTTHPSSNRFDFRVSRPGTLLEIKTDLDRGTATVKRIQTNTWGIVHMLHTFTGVRTTDPDNHRDWLFTYLWSASMDAVAAGLALMALGSIWMWYRLKTKRRLGALVLASGFAATALFLLAPGF
ncbi:MAG: hypothetical protein ACM336_20415 [Acidobacteriota bacterium]|nr:hypothetical protein [Bryobacteraceae bacterium]